MAGTTLDRELTAVRTGRHPFALATPADDADIRRLLRENSMPGQISLTLEREPDYFADANLPGTEKQSIIANEGGRVVCVGNCAIRERFVNGQPRRVGYLGGLRLDAQASGRFDILRRGYEFFHELQAERPADYYFTSIAADNVPARKFLERGLPGMPAYEFVGEFITVLLPVKHRPRDCPAPNTGPVDFSKLLDHLDEQGRAYQFAPCWSAGELSALQSLNLKAEDFCVCGKNGRIDACAALWDQRPFKQTVIRGYSLSLAIARPMVNIAASMFGTPRLPAVGMALAHAFVSHLGVTSENPAGLSQLLAQLSALAAAQGIEFLTIGFAANDPRLTQMRGKFHCLEYRSRIYMVHWPDLGGSARDLDERCLGPEVALL